MSTFFSEPRRPPAEQTRPGRTVVLPRLHVGRHAGIDQADAITDHDVRWAQSHLSRSRFSIMMKVGVGATGRAEGFVRKSSIFNEEAEIGLVLTTNTGESVLLVVAELNHIRLSITKRIHIQIAV